MERRGSNADRRAELLAAAAVALFYAALFAIAPTDRPVIIADSPGYLAVGRWIAGAGVIPQQFSPFYSWAYGAVFAVPYSVTADIGIAYAFGVALNCLCGGILFILLRKIVLRVVPQTDRLLATLFATTGAGWAGISVQVGQIWPEILLAMLVACWALSILRLGENESRASLELSVLAVLLFATHHRMFGTVLVTAVLLAAHRRRVGTRQFLMAILVLVTGTVLTLVVDGLAKEALYPRGPTGVPLQLALDAPRKVFQVLVGELWATVVATGGLVTLARSHPTHRSMAVVGIVGAFACTAALGAVQLGAAVEAGAAFRADFLAYGRYVAPFVPVLLALGTSQLVLSQKSSVPALALMSVALMFLIQAAVNGTALGGFSVPLQFTGLLGLGFFEFPLDVVRPSFIACAFAAALVAVTGRLRPRFASGAVVAMVLLAAVSGTSRVSRYLDRADERGNHIVEFSDTLPPSIPIYVDPSTGAGIIELLQMLRPERHFVPERPASPSGSTLYIVHGQQWVKPRNRPVSTLSRVGELEVLSCVGRSCPLRPHDETQRPEG